MKPPVMQLASLASGGVMLIGVCLELQSMHEAFLALWKFTLVLMTVYMKTSLQETNT